MDDQDKKKLVPEERNYRTISVEEGRQLRLWWRQLTDTDTDPATRTFDRGVSAILRRAESVEAVLLTEGFRALVHRLPDKNLSAEALEIWATIALLTSHLREEAENVSLGTRMGQPKKDTATPLVSELRLQQLSQATTSEEFVRRMRRTLALVGNQGVSVVCLADSIKQWWIENNDKFYGRPSHRLAFSWGNDYFKAVSEYASAKEQ